MSEPTLLEIFLDPEYLSDPNCAHSLDDVKAVIEAFRLKRTTEANETANWIEKWRQSLLSYIDSEWAVPPDCPNCIDPENNPGYHADDDSDYPVKVH